MGAASQALAHDAWRDLFTCEVLPTAGEALQSVVGLSPSPPSLQHQQEKAGEQSGALLEVQSHNSTSSLASDLPAENYLKMLIECLHQGRLATTLAVVSAYRQSGYAGGDEVKGVPPRGVFAHPDVQARRQMDPKKNVFGVPRERLVPTASMRRLLRLKCAPSPTKDQPQQGEVLGTSGPLTAPHGYGDREPCLDHKERER